MVGTNSNDTLTSLYSDNINDILNGIYYAIITGGLLMNSYICYLVLMKKVVTSPFMVLIFNICISDIVVCISTLPYVMVDLNTLRIPKSESIQWKCVCIFTYGKGMRFCALGVQIFTICLSNINRYLTIKQPDSCRFNMSLSDAKRFAVIIWITSFCLTLPDFLPLTFNFNARICFRDWPSFNPFFAMCYKVITFGVGFALPTIVIITTIVLSYMHNRRAIESRNTRSFETRKKVARAKKDMSCFVLPLVISFFICLGPLAVYFFITSFVLPKYDNSASWHRRNQEYVKIMDIFTTLSVVNDSAIYLWRRKPRNHNVINDHT